MEQPSNPLLDEYLKSLSEKELKGYYIAKNHLGSSFDLSKSLGFTEWTKTLPTQTYSQGENAKI
jgi:hypothetical protein